MQQTSDINGPEKPDQLVELVVVSGLMEAEIIKARLENFGIHCMLKFEAIGRVMGITADGLGKVQVMVPPQSLEGAREIMENVDRDNAGEQAE